MNSMHKLYMVLGVPELDVLDQLYLTPALVTILCFCGFSEYLEYFAPDFSLEPEIVTKMENQNTKQVCGEVNVNSLSFRGAKSTHRAALHTSCLGFLA